MGLKVNGSEVYRLHEWSPEHRMKNSVPSGRRRRHPKSPMESEEDCAWRDKRPQEDIKIYQS